MQIQRLAMQTGQGSVQASAGHGQSTPKGGIAGKPGSLRTPRACKLHTHTVSYNREHKDAVLCTINNNDKTQARRLGAESRLDAVESWLNAGAEFRSVPIGKPEYQEEAQQLNSHIYPWSS